MKKLQWWKGNMIKYYLFLEQLLLRFFCAGWYIVKYFTYARQYNLIYAIFWIALQMANNLQNLRFKMFWSSVLNSCIWQAIKF